MMHGQPSIKICLYIVSSWLDVSWWTAKSQQSVRKNKTRKCFNTIPVHGKKIISMELIETFSDG